MGAVGSEPAPIERIGSLPPETPLAMPVQDLRTFEPRRRPAAPSLLGRRALLFAAVTVLTAFGAFEMYEALRVAGLTVLETLLLVLFTLLFAWVSLSFISALIGFILSFGEGVVPQPGRAHPKSRTALLVVTYNEEPDQVFGRVRAIYESLRETGWTNFDVFILSDTTDPFIWLAEEDAYLRLTAATGSQNIFYRHRAKNTARKTGNIADWVRRFGGAYEFMLVLDADSLMQGDSILQLVAAAENDPAAGLIQSLPLPLNGQTVFARLQQFAGRIYGPMIARGINWWYGHEGNFWGHNAVIRVRAFAESCGLPELKGRKPFGGHILSHDFVEAALLVRNGWRVCMLPELRGSYEEGPPTLTAYIARDRRWCQGNLQHFKLLSARGLRPMSRFHFVEGIVSYLAAPLWLSFLLLGILVALQAQFIRPEYFPPGASLFPQWPAQDPVRAAYVFAFAMAMLIVPKILGLVAMQLKRQDRISARRWLKALPSAVLEIALSALLAPIMMFKQTRAVLEIVLGLDSGWPAQQRQAQAESIRRVASIYWTPTALGLLLAVAAGLVSFALFLWMLPVIIGLALAIPLAAFTSRPASGQWFRTKEDDVPPPVVSAARAYADELSDVRSDQALRRWFESERLRRFHLSTLPPAEQRRRGEVDPNLVVGMARIAECETFDEAERMLSRPELFALLCSPVGVNALAACRR